MRKITAAFIIFLLTTILAVSAYALGTLEIPNGVTRIEDSTFENDQSIYSVILPDKLEYIGHRAFANSSLKKLKIPDSVKIIEEDAFEGIPENAVIFVNYGSAAYDAILSVNLPCKLIEFGLDIWEYLDYTESVDDEGRLTVSIYGLKDPWSDIDDNIYTSIDIGDIIIPDVLVGRRKISEMRIEDEAFWGYTSHTWTGIIDCHLSLPDCVTYIGDRAFANTAFTCDLILPEGLKYIGDEAFFWSRRFTGELNLPSSLEHLGEKAFYHDDSLTGHCVIPGSCKEIGGECFAYCDGLQALTLQDGLEKIGEDAFAYCSGLTGHLKIPNTVRSIGGCAFTGCAFYGDLIIPEGISVIGEGAFSNNQFDGVLSLPDALMHIKDRAFANNPFSGSLSLPYNLKTIGNSAFEHCYGFTGSLEIPDSVTKVGSRAFVGCYGFTGSLKLSESLTGIGSSAFEACDGFTGSLKIPDAVREIGYDAFWGCSGFNGTLTLGSSLKRIGTEAFRNCGFSGDLKLPDGLSDLEEGAFAGCKGLNGTVILSSGFNSYDMDYEWYYLPLGGYSGIFEECTGIRRVVIPNGVKAIAPKMFYNCTGLLQVDFGSSLEIIHRSAFQGCTGLLQVTLPKTIRSISSYAFKDCVSLTGILDLSGIENLGTAYSPYGWQYMQIRGQFFNCPNLKGVILSNTGLLEGDRWWGSNDHNMYKDTFSGHGPQFTIYCREGSDTAYICLRNKFKCEYIYGISYFGGLISGAHAFGEPISLNGYYSSDETILKLRAAIVSLELLETVQQVEVDINNLHAFYRLLNNQLHFENLPVGDYYMKIEVLLENAEEYLLIEVSKFTIQKSVIRAWGIDDFTLPSGIYIQGTSFTPRGSLQANRDIEKATVLVTDRNKNIKYSNMVYPNSKNVAMAELLNGFRMEDLFPQTYRITVEFLCSEGTVTAAQSDFRLYSNTGEINDEKTLEIILFCEDYNNAFLFDSYCGDYTDYLSKMDWTDAAAMIMCNVKDIVSQEVIGFIGSLFGGSGGGYVKSLYKKTLLEMMSHFEEDSVDLGNLKSFKDYFKYHFNTFSTIEGWEVEYINENYELFEKECVDNILNHYDKYLDENLLEDTIISIKQYCKGFVGHAKKSMESLGRIKNVAKYGSDLVEIISDAIEDHTKGLMALASLANAYGDRIPDEMKEALEEIMDTYQNQALIVFDSVFEKVELEISKKAVDKMIDLAGETAFTAFLGSSKLGYKISKFMLDRGFELMGVKELADSDTEILTLGNLTIQTSLAYREAVLRVRGGNGPEPDPGNADTSAEALNQVYYTFEACKYTLNELYEALEEDARNHDLGAFNYYADRQWRLNQLEMK